MSANQGRQSPDPETQRPEQGTAAQAKPNDQGAAPSQHYAEDASNEQKEKLASNPKGPLEDAAEQKTSKGPGNEPLGGK